ncbi:MAG: ATPase, partial [Actinobacteria bacterium]|nr:ATPase [Actinomycetota bacterium]
LGKLHPAVTRAGRRLAETEFTPLAREEAQRWLAARRVERALPGPTSLADLYAVIDGGERSPTQPVVGFG